MGVVERGDGYASETGKPVLPIEERPVPQSDVPGERTSPTQPFPLTLPRLAPQALTPDKAFGLSDADRDACRKALADLTGAAVFTPPSLTGMLAVPGNVGGINWSGFAWDARRERLIVSISNLPFKVRLIPRDRFTGGDRSDLRGETAPQQGTPYAMNRAPLRAPSGVPCAPPPWGELVAVDLAAGKVAWRTPLGTMDELAPGVGAADHLRGERQAVRGDRRRRLGEDHRGEAGRRDRRLRPALITWWAWAACRARRDCLPDRR